MPHLTQKLFRNYTRYSAAQLSFEGYTENMPIMWLLFRYNLFLLVLILAFVVTIAIECLSAYSSSRCLHNLIAKLEKVVIFPQRSLANDDEFQDYNDDYHTHVAREKYGNNGSDSSSLTSSASPKDDKAFFAVLQRSAYKRRPTYDPEAAEQFVDFLKREMLYHVMINPESPIMGRRPATELESGVPLARRYQNLVDDPIAMLAEITGGSCAGRVMLEDIPSKLVDENTVAERKDLLPAFAKIPQTLEEKRGASQSSMSLGSVNILMSNPKRQEGSAAKAPRSIPNVNPPKYVDLAGRQDNQIPQFLPIEPAHGRPSEFVNASLVQLVETFYELFGSFHWQKDILTEQMQVEVGQLLAATAVTPSPKSDEFSYPIYPVAHKPRFTSTTYHSSVAPSEFGNVSVAPPAIHRPRPALLGSQEPLQRRSASVGDTAGVAVFSNKSLAGPPDEKVRPQQACRPDPQQQVRPTAVGYRAVSELANIQTRMLRSHAEMLKTFVVQFRNLLNQFDQQRRRELIFRQLMNDQRREQRQTEIFNNSTGLRKPANGQRPPVLLIEPEAITGRRDTTTPIHREAASRTPRKSSIGSVFGAISTPKSLQSICDSAKSFLAGKPHLRDEDVAPDTPSRHSRHHSNADKDETCLAGVVTDEMYSMDVDEKTPAKAVGKGWSRRPRLTSLSKVVSHVLPADWGNGKKQHENPSDNPQTEQKAPSEFTEDTRINAATLCDVETNRVANKEIFLQTTDHCANPSTDFFTQDIESMYHPCDGYQPPPFPAAAAQVSSTPLVQVIVSGNNVGGGYNPDREPAAYSSDYHGQRKSDYQPHRRCYHNSLDCEGSPRHRVDNVSRRGERGRVLAQPCGCDRRSHSAGPTGRCCLAPQATARFHRPHTQTPSTGLLDTVVGLVKNLLLFDLKDGLRRLQDNIGIESSTAVLSLLRAAASGAVWAIATGIHNSEAALSERPLSDLELLWLADSAPCEDDGMQIAEFLREVRRQAKRDDASSNMTETPSKTSWRGQSPVNSQAFDVPPSNTGGRQVSFNRRASAYTFEDTRGQHPRPHYHRRPGYASPVDIASFSISSVSPHSPPRR